MKNLQKVHGASRLVDAGAILSVDCGFKRQARRTLLNCFFTRSFFTATVCKHLTDPCRSNFKIRHFVRASVVKWWALFFRYQGFVFFSVFPAVSCSMNFFMLDCPMRVLPSLFVVVGNYYILEKNKCWRQCRML